MKYLNLDLCLTGTGLGMQDGHMATVKTIDQALSPTGVSNASVKRAACEPSKFYLNVFRTNSQSRWKPPFLKCNMSLLDPLLFVSVLFWLNHRDLIRKIGQHLYLGVLTWSGHNGATPTCYRYSPF